MIFLYLLDAYVVRILVFKLFHEYENVVSKFI